MRRVKIFKEIFFTKKLSFRFRTTSMLGFFQRGSSRTQKTCDRSCFSSWFSCFHGRVYNFRCWFFNDIINIKFISTDGPISHDNQYVEICFIASILIVSFSFRLVLTSWIFATFFFLPLCAIIGPVGRCGSIPFARLAQFIRRSVIPCCKRENTGWDRISSSSTYSSQPRAKDDFLSLFPSDVLGHRHTHTFINSLFFHILLIDGDDDVKLQHYRSSIYLQFITEIIIDCWCRFFFVLSFFRSFVLFNTNRIISFNYRKNRIRS